MEYFCLILCVGDNLNVKQIKVYQCWTVFYGRKKTWALQNWISLYLKKAMLPARTMVNRWTFGQLDMVYVSQTSCFK